MKKLLITLMAIATLTTCCDNLNANAQGSAKTNKKEYVEVLYFHGKQRCVTCNAIEKLTKEVLNKEFVEQLKEGRVVFKTIDISTDEGEKIADKYEVTWSSLFVNKWKDGKQTKYNMTEFGFSNARNSPDIFKQGVRKRINEQLK